MHSQTPPFTVLILGSNIPALALALALSQKDIAFILLERSEHIVPPQTTRPIALHPHGVAILDQLGVWEQLSQETIPASEGWWGGVTER